MDRASLSQHPIDPRLPSQVAHINPTSSSIPTNTATSTMTSKDPRVASRNDQNDSLNGNSATAPTTQKSNISSAPPVADNKTKRENFQVKPEPNDPAPSASPPGGSKIFVGGLSWETDETSLRRYFETFGQVIDCVIMRDRHTGHPRGFGFVTFSDDAVAGTAASRRHDLDGRQVEAKRAVPRNEFPAGAPLVPGSVRASTPQGAAAPLRVNHTTRGKVFVGGLPSQCGNDEFKAYFSSYGEVVDAQVMIDHNTGNSRGFGFVTFADESSVDAVVGPGRSNTRHDIMGKNVEVKRAEPKGATASSRPRMDPYGSSGGRGGVGGLSSGPVGGNSGGVGEGSSAANAAATAAYYGNYASASLAEQYGAYYNNPQWQQYYAAMGYNFNAYPQGYNPYTYLQAYMSNVANGAGANNGAAGVANEAGPGVPDQQASVGAAAGGYDGRGVTGGMRGGTATGGRAGYDGNVGDGGQNQGGPQGGSSGSGGGRRSSRRDERYHPYR